MGEILYRKLEIGECERIQEIDASQYIGRAWREVDGVRQLVKIDYMDPDFPAGYDEHLAALKSTMEEGGAAYGAFDTDGRLIGFVTVNREVFGKRFKYVLLDQMFVNKNDRNRGIGKRLFKFAVDTARDWDVDKLYICAGSAEETILFYRAVGCREAEEINMKLYEDDPRDWQLEYMVKE